MAGPIINGQSYSLILLRVLEWDEKGRPSKCVVGYDDTTFKIGDQSVSDEFITAFVLEAATTPRTRNN